MFVKWKHINVDIKLNNISQTDRQKESGMISYRELGIKTILDWKYNLAYLRQKLDIPVCSLC